MPPAPSTARGSVPAVLATHFQGETQNSMLALHTLCHHPRDRAATPRERPEPRQSFREQMVSATEEVMGDSGRWEGKGDPAAGVGRDVR